MKSLNVIPRSVMIKGAGDIATGVAHRLWQSGFDVIMLELAQPLVVRRTVAFAEAVYAGSAKVESVTARLCASPENVYDYLERREIPVLIDFHGETIAALKPATIVDAIMAKRKKAVQIDDALLVIGLGPGFTAGKDVHAVIETNRGHNLGKVIYTGSADEDTSDPAEVAGIGKERLLRSPASGIFTPLKEIGDTVRAGEVVALVDKTIIKAATGGLVRGLLYPGLTVSEGMKVGDIDPRGRTVDYCTISDKARAVGGGVLEAILNRYHLGKDCSFSRH
ncbi:MAG TPA: selenium-dependent molybdenum cofactor biosynthesis protein YqeB [Candidatus Limnocylindrales bacterium]|nr:selenium-dependent molybdenum cofactor biosynthesis protein YqeB [Candidatus Limnocylindrales bacterium]